MCSLPQVDPFFVPLTEEEREEFGEVRAQGPQPLAVTQALPCCAACSDSSRQGLSRCACRSVSTLHSTAVKRCSM